MIHDFRITLKKCVLLHKIAHFKGFNLITLLDANVILIVSCGLSWDKCGKIFETSAFLPSIYGQIGEIQLWPDWGL